MQEHASSMSYQGAARAVNVNVPSVKIIFLTANSHQMDLMVV